MSILSKKHLVQHVIIGVIITLIFLIILLFPTRVHGSANHYYADEVYDAEQEVQRAQEDVYDTYIPRSEIYRSSPYDNIGVARNRLDQAKQDLRSAELNDYMQQRIVDGDRREQEIQNQIQSQHRPYQTPHSQSRNSIFARDR